MLTFMLEKIKVLTWHILRSSNICGQRETFLEFQQTLASTSVGVLVSEWLRSASLASAARSPSTLALVPVRDFAAPTLPRAWPSLVFPQQSAHLYCTSHQIGAASFESHRSRSVVVMSRPPRPRAVPCCCVVVSSLASPARIPAGFGGHIRRPQALRAGGVSPEQVPAAAARLEASSAGAIAGGARC
ncbi:hypothetical protein SEVIR_5G256950v4 [Setaria viridis]